MAGRPPLRIGQHGKITREKVKGVWVARTRYRDADGVVRRIERKGPFDEFDKHGKLAEDALLEAIAERRPPAEADALGPDTLVMVLVDRHLERLAEDGRSPATLDTYAFAADKLRKFLGGVRVREASTARLDAALRSMRTAHGATMAKQAKTILRGGLQLAVMANVLGANPVRDVQPLKSKAAPKGAVALTAEQLRELLAKLRASDYCQTRDLIDPITLAMATGLRRGELLALRWSDFDADAGTITVAGKLLRAKGKGLQWIDTGKTASSLRTLALSPFAVDMLTARRGEFYQGEHPMIFPSAASTWRDPNNFAKQWRKVRDDLGLPDPDKVTSHSFRKTIATLIDDEGLSARVGADQLGHAKPSMTQDRYMARGRVHPEVAALLERTVINDE